jgi:hypothetical protein
VKTAETSPAPDTLVPSSALDSPLRQSPSSPATGGQTRIERVLATLADGPVPISVPHAFLERRSKDVATNAPLAPCYAVYGDTSGGPLVTYYRSDA